MRVASCRRASRGPRQPLCVIMDGTITSPIPLWRDQQDLYHASLCAIANKTITTPVSACGVSDAATTTPCHGPTLHATTAQPHPYKSSGVFLLPTFAGSITCLSFLFAFFFIVIHSNMYQLFLMHKKCNNRRSKNLSILPRFRGFFTMSFISINPGKDHSR